jgi:hypothetical protein
MNNIILEELLKKTETYKDSYITVRSIPLGDSGHIRQCYCLKTLSQNKYTQALYNLLAEMEKGLNKDVPALFLVYYDPTVGIQLLEGQILRD